jgi:hypothetical protein
MEGLVVRAAIDCCRTTLTEVLGAVTIFLLYPGLHFRHESQQTNRKQESDWGEWFSHGEASVRSSSVRVAEMLISAGMTPVSV